MRRRALFACIAAILGAACRGHDTGAPVTSPTAEQWSLRQPPLWSVAESSPNAPTPFYFVTPSRGLILEDGTVVVENGTELVFLTAAGAARAVVNRQGVGPGEFYRISALFEAGLHVVTFDNSKGELSFFDRGGNYIRSVRPPVLVGTDAVSGFVRDAGPVAVRVAHKESVETYLLLDSAGATSRQLFATTPSLALDVPWTTAQGHQWRVLGAIGCSASNLSALLGDVLYIAMQSTGEIVSVDVRGEARVIWERSSRPLIDDKDFVKQSRGASFVPQRVRDEVASDMGRAGSPIPYSWTNIISDAAGRIWLKTSECKVSDGPATWEIVDTSGVFLGTLTSPHRILAARDRRVLAVYTDSLGRNFVSMFLLDAARSR